MPQQGTRETSTDCLCMSASFPHAYWSVKWPSSESQSFNGQSGERTQFGYREIAWRACSMVWVMTGSVHRMMWESTIKSHCQHTKQGSQVHHSSFLSACSQPKHGFHHWGFANFQGTQTWRWGSWNLSWLSMLPNQAQEYNFGRSITLVPVSLGPEQCIHA